MAVYFSGVHTGDYYQVGSTVSRNGDTYTVEANGSFTNDRTGVNLVGSSQAANVSWVSDDAPSGSGRVAASALTGAGAGPGAERVVTNPSGRPASKAGGAGPGSPSVVTRRGGGGTLKQAASGALGPWSTDALGRDALIPGRYETKNGFVQMERPSQSGGRSFPMGPFDIEMSPYFPPAQYIEDEIGEADFLSPGWFATWGKAIGDIGHNVNRAIDAAVDRYEEKGATPPGFSWNVPRASNGQVIGGGF